MIKKPWLKHQNNFKDRDDINEFELRLKGQAIAQGFVFLEVINIFMFN